jgi:hypothetical protein
VREAEFTFTFAAPPATDGNYKYYLIITTKNITDALLDGNDSTLDYFASPDDTTASQNQRFIEQYYGAAEYDNMQKVYQDYFAKWYEYFVFDRASGLRVFTDINGYLVPYVWTNPLTQYFPKAVTLYNTLYPSANQLRLTIPCPPYSVFYFGLVTVDNTGGQRLIADGLGLAPVNAQTNGTVINEQQDNSVDTRINGRLGLDITSYTVKITEY